MGTTNSRMFGVLRNGWEVKIMSKHNDCNCNHHEPENRYYFFDSSNSDVRFTQRDGRILGIILLCYAAATFIFAVMK